MTLKNLTKTLIPTLLAVLLLAPVAFANGPAPESDDEHAFHYGAMRGEAGEAGVRGHRFLRRAARYLDLTEEQRTAIRQIFEDARGEGEPIRSEMRGLREELKTLLDSGASADEVGQVAIALHAVRGQAKDLRADIHERVKEQLTAEQIDRLEDMKEARGEGRGRRADHRRGGLHGR
ncbi:MAG: Spy/CpxP family protein refolding chaperone [Acidobacteriota bacterium]